jgi:hypothetical protein
MFPPSYKQFAEKLSRRQGLRNSTTGLGLSAYSAAARIVTTDRSSEKTLPAGTTLQQPSE